MLLRSVDVGVVALLDDLRDGSESAVPSRFSFGMLTLDPDMVRPLSERFGYYHCWLLLGLTETFNKSIQIQSASKRQGKGTAPVPDSIEGFTRVVFKRAPLGPEPI